VALLTESNTTIAKLEFSNSYLGFWPSEIFKFLTYPYFSNSFLHLSSNYLASSLSAKHLRFLMCKALSSNKWVLLDVLFEQRFIMNSGFLGNFCFKAPVLKSCIIFSGASSSLKLTKPKGFFTVASISQITDKISP